MHYVDEGAGDPIVLVHGNPSWSFESRNIIKALSGQYRCIAMDHLGFGLSDKPWDYSYLPQEQAKNLEALLESLHLERITLIVNDWGGPIGLSYAIHHPEKIHFIIITNTWMWSVRNDFHFISFSAFLGGPIGHWLIRRRNFFAKNLLLMSFGDPAKLPPHIHQQFLEPLSKPDERKGNWTFPGQIIGASNWLGSLWDQRQVLKDKIAVIAWGGKDDAFREKELQTWIKAFPEARVLRLPNSGHFIIEENSTELVEAIKSLVH